MPTPNDDTLTAMPATLPGTFTVPRVPHTTCPPDDQRLNIWRHREQHEHTGTEHEAPDVLSEQHTTATANGSDTDKMESMAKGQSEGSHINVEVEVSTGDILSPMSSTSDARETDHRPPSQSLLVPVAAESTCGLTDDIPTLTTYFEGEIIGDRYSFQTKHPDWGSNDKIDMAHWWRFPAWRPLAKSAKKPDFAHRNFAQRENIFMRWKEHFLVPDHRVRTISGASFEGFYYICFNQVTGNISGIYFHAKSEKYQQLELAHVEDRGCFGAMEFR
ncbi:MAG: hypothetical protein M1817_001580 [Caeruleum heppii]|nr:MAG: hypothetical protein M1817_001580 [Caeruleum heppii]